MAKRNTSKNTNTAKVRGRGRPALIGDRAFIEVHNKSESVDDIVNAFSTLREMDEVKARTYVSIRAWNLRNKGVELKLFPRGRKPVSA